MQTGASDISKSIQLSHLPDYASWILKHQFEEFLALYLQYARGASLPLLKHLEKWTDEQILEYNRPYIDELLTQISRKDTKRYIRNLLDRFESNHLQIVQKQEVQAEDITIINFVRKQCFLQLLPLYTSDMQHALLIISEIDLFTVEVESALSNSFMRSLREQVEEQSHFNVQVTNTTPGVIFIFDLEEMKEVYTNPMVEKLFGYTSGELTEMGTSILTRLVHSDDLEKIYKVLSEFVVENNDEIRSLEYRLKHKDGRYHWVRNYGSVFKRGTDGKPRQIIVIGIDVNKEKTIAEQLLFREEQFVEAQEMAGLGSFEWDLISKSLQVSEQVKRLLHFEDNTLHELTERIHPDDKELVKSKISEAVRDGVIFDCEYRYLVDDVEKTFWSKARVQQRNGHPVLRGTVMDITERNRLISRLRKSEELYKESQALSHIGNWVFDIPSNAISWSDELYRIYGLEPGQTEITYGLYFSLIHPEDREFVKKNISDCISTKKPYEMFHRVSRPDGTIRMVHGIGNILLDNDGEPLRLYGTAQDVTDRHKLLMQLEESTKLYKQAQAITHIGNYVFDIATNTLEWSDELYRIYELDVKEKLTYDEVFEFTDAADADLVENTMRTAIENKQSFDFYYHITTRHNRTKILHARGEVTRDDAGNLKVIGTAQDVTERQLLVEQLQVSDTLYKQAQSLSHIGNWTWDCEHDIFTCSDEIYRIYNSDQKSKTLSLSDFLQWNGSGDRQKLQSMISGEAGVDFEIHHHSIAVNGSSKALHTIGELLINEQGKVERVFGTTQDVTQEKKIKDELLQNQLFTQKIADATPSIITTYNLHTGKYSYVSGGLRKLLGFQPQKVLDEGINFFLSILHPDDIDELMHRNAKALEEANSNIKGSEELVVEFQYRMKHADGTYRWFHTYGTVFDRNPEGKVEHILNISIDITDRINAEEKIREQEHFIQHIADASPTVLYLFDSKAGSVLYINREIQQVLGYSPEEIMGMKTDVIAKLYHPSDAERIGERLKQYNNSSVPASFFQFECRMKHVTGEWRWLLIREIVFKRAADGRILEVLGAALDISGRKAIEETLYQRTLELQQSNTNLEEFAYVASHDLQEPLRKISTFGDRLLNTQKEILSEEGKRYLEKIINSSVRMQQMINDLLSISTISGDRAYISCNLKNLLKEVLVTLEHKIEEKRAVVTMSDLPSARGIPSQFRQLFQNLISNALKFSVPDAAPEINISHHYVSYQRGAGARQLLEIRIADNGIGFDNRYADKIFTIFQRLHSRSEYEGTGIGLAICKKIVENHGGTITAQSEPGKGSRFTISIPV